MSNKIVDIIEPMIYRAVIDDVIQAIKPEFDDYGVAEDVLSDLQSRWENKVIASHVAEFEHPVSTQQPPPAQPYPPPLSHPSLPMQAYPQYMAAASSQVKTEPVESRFPLPGAMSSYMPSLPGPTLPGPRQQHIVPPVQHHHYSANGASRIAYPQTIPSVPPSQTTSQARIPQVDGPSSSASESPSPSPTSYAPRPSHPSLPQPSASPSRPVDSEEINSDLDDSDTDAEEEEQEGALGETDIVFCTYDKVARVKNKWKCVLKDGMIHVNGKDYLFAKCTCEFEW